MRTIGSDGKAGFLGNQRTLLLSLAALALLGALLANTSEAIGAEGEEEEEDGVNFAPSVYRSEHKARVAELEKLDRRQLRVLFDIINDLLVCINDLVTRILKGDSKFPKSCCRLPILNWICPKARRMSPPMMIE